MCHPYLRLDLPPLRFPIKILYKFRTQRSDTKSKAPRNVS
jgi:hypothetical protein